MNREPESELVEVEVVPMPREQVGPFLLLGVDKTASAEEIEAAWAQRVLWARKGQIAVPLEDINWAREVLTDPAKRRQADLSSLNPDTASGILQQLNEQYGQGIPRWIPYDDQRLLAEEPPPIPLPTVAEILADVAPPALPDAMPAVSELLQELAGGPLDPWGPEVAAASR